MEKLQELILDLWKPNSTRSRYSDFKPVFYRYEGCENENKLNDICSTIEKNKDSSTIISDGPLIFMPRIDVLSQIKKELPIMDLNCITKDFLLMFSDEELNEVFLTALNYTVGLANRNKIFNTRKQQENFICNLIVFSIQYLLSIPFEKDHAPKIIYYCYNSMDERDFWFLILCYAMGIDTVVIEPNGDSIWFSYDLDHLSQKMSSLKSRSNYSFSERVNLGKPINKVRTSVSTLSSQIDESLYGETGIFKPWQFRGRTFNHVQLDGALIDLENSWDQEARLREGFKADNDSITVPSFYVEIEGVERDRAEYMCLLSRIMSAQSIHIDQKQGFSLFSTIKPMNEAVKLVFAMKPNGSFDSKKLSQNSGYVFDYISTETMEMIVDKLNILLERCNLNTKDERVRAANIVLSISKPIARMIENFDFPFTVPKVALFLNKEERLNQDVQLMLSFLFMLGFDIAVFAPSGVSGLTDNNRSIIRLSEMNYDMEMPMLSSINERRFSEKKRFKSVLDLFR